MVAKRLGQKAITGTLWLSLVRIITLISMFAANVALARILSPKEIGNFSLALSVKELFYILGSWSFPLAIIQSKEITKSFIDTAYILSLFLGVIIFLVVLISSFFIRIFYSNEIINLTVVLSGLYIFNILGNCYGATLERELMYDKFSIVQLFTFTLPWIFAIGLALLGFGSWSLVGREVLAIVITFFGYRAFSNWRFSMKINIEEMKKLLRFGSKMFVSRGTEIISAFFGNFAIGTLTNTTQLGYFDQSYKLSELGNRFGGPAFVQVAFSAYSRLQDQKEKLSQGYYISNYFLIRILVALFLIFLLLGESIILFLYGEKWQPAGKFLNILAFYSLCLPLFENMKQLLYSQGYLNKVIKLRVIQMIFFIPGILLALKLYDIIAASYVFNISILIALIIAGFYIKKLIIVNLKELIFGPLAACTITFFIFQQISRLLPLIKANFISLLQSGLLIIVPYILILLVIEKKLLTRNFSYLLVIFKKEKK